MPGTPNRERIHSLVHRYFELHSHRDWPGLSDMFTPDVTLIHPVYPKSTGRDAVGRFFTDSRQLGNPTINR